MTAAQMRDDKRGDTRHRTLKGARIAFNSTSTINCTVRDMSSTGAKLLVASILGIPDSFDLLLSNNERHRCRVVWRTATELGVEFRTEH